MSLLKGKSIPNNNITPEQKTDFYKLCPKCGNFSHIIEKHTYCLVCGEKLIEECRNCKAKIENPVGKYCAKCGKKYLMGSKLQD